MSLLPKLYTYHEVLYDRSTWRWCKSQIVAREYPDVIPCGDTELPAGMRRDFTRRPELDPDRDYDRARRDMMAGDIIQLQQSVKVWGADDQAVEALATLSGSMELQAGSLLYVTELGKKHPSHMSRRRVELVSLWLPVGREGFMLHTFVCRDDYRFWLHPKPETMVSASNLIRRYTVPVFNKES